MQPAAMIFPYERGLALLVNFFGPAKGIYPLHSPIRSGASPGLIPANSPQFVWKDLHLYRTSSEDHYEHIDELLTKEVNWELISAFWPDMLRVAVSIAEGLVTPSTVLRRLATYSRKNKLYFAFRELGCAVRTVFLLRFLSDIDLRHRIQAATNKSEAFNKFAQWAFFAGGGVIAENLRDEQRKIIKYNHLVTNLLIYHNVVNMSRALARLPWRTTRSLRTR
jgi:TnpA family transposase